MNLNILKSQLENAGFRIGPSHKENSPWMAYRRSNIQARPCECNSDKPGIQLTVTPYEMDLNGQEWQSSEVNVTGEFGGKWYSLTCYSMKPEEISQNLPEVENTLVAAWNGLDQNQIGETA